MIRLFLPWMYYKIPVQNPSELAPVSSKRPEAKVLAILMTDGTETYLYSGFLLLVLSEY